MSLRDALDHVMNRGSLVYTFSCIYNVYYHDNDKYTLPDVFTAYTDVVRLILELPYMKTNENYISLSSQVNDEEEHVHVGLHDTVEGELYALDYVPWSDLTACLIEDKIGLDIHDQLAHILWEITFHGFTPEAIEKQANKLKDIIEDEDNTHYEILDLDDLLKD